eukprot:gene18010-29569_t
MKGLQVKRREIGLFLIGAALLLAVLRHLHATAGDESRVFAQSTASGGSDPEYDALREWLVSGGVEFSKVSGHKRALAGGGRGLFATADAKKGDDLIVVPSQFWISQRSVMHQSAIAHVLRDDKYVWDKLAEDQTWVVVMGLEWERSNPYSPWKPYVDFMRKQESPIWWSDSELALLQSQVIVDE